MLLKIQRLDAALLSRKCKALGIRVDADHTFGTLDLCPTDSTLPNWPQPLIIVSTKALGDFTEREGLTQMATVSPSSTPVFTTQW
jgi:hypothetical protein